MILALLPQGYKAELARTMGPSAVKEQTERFSVSKPLCIQLFIGCANQRESA